MAQMVSSGDPSRAMVLTTLQYETLHESEASEGFYFLPSAISVLGKIGRFLKKKRSVTNC